MGEDVEDMSCWKTFLAEVADDNGDVLDTARAVSNVLWRFSGIKKAICLVANS